MGREHDLATARGLLLRPRVRLLTLTGPPGTGKTRLALELAASVADRFAAGVVFVSLAPLADPLLVISTIGQALGLREVAGRSALAVLADALHDRQILLVLDNFEHLLPAASDIAELLGACPEPTILVTSRAMLRIRGEYQLAIPPLSLPDPSTPATVQDLATSAAVALFVDRAQMVCPDFALTDESVATVAEICHRLDGLPLAIELAAAHTRLLTPAALLRRLERRLPLLAGGPRDLPARQQTLRDAIAWSYDLLDQDERVLFQRLAVFAGGCTLEAAEAVCDDGARDEGRATSDDAARSSLAPHPPPLVVLASLTAKSMVQQGNVAGEPRLTLLETMREFGLDQLAASGELEAARRRHASYFLALAEAADRPLFGPDQLVWLDRLEVEHDNFRAALAWSADRLTRTLPDSDDAQIGLRLVAALHIFWYLHGHASEGRAWFARLLPDFEAAAGPIASQTIAAARAHRAAGWLANIQGDYAVARHHHEASVAIWRALGDIRGLGDALMVLGTAIMVGSGPEAAASVFVECEAVLRTLGDPRRLSMATLQLGRLAQHRGDRALAVRYYEESCALAIESGDRVCIGHTLRQHGIWYAQGGDLAHAEYLYVEALTAVRDLGDAWVTARGLLCLAGLAIERGQFRRAVRLLGAADSLISSNGGRLYPYEIEEQDGYLAQARAALGEAGFAVAWADGQAMTREDAIKYGLQTDVAKDARTA